MKTFIIAILAAAVVTAGCATSASDGGDLGGTAATGSTGTTKTGARAVTTASAVSREVTIPAGTALQLSLNTAVASDTSHVEDAVSAALTNPVVVDGRTVLPAGTTVAGVVSAAEDSGRVKGRALVALDFTSLTTGGSSYGVSTERFTRQAPATKGQDAEKIGIGAGAGAVIGALLGGKKGAGTGAVIGGGAGTGLVLATTGDEVRLANGADVSTQLRAPLTVRLRN